MFFHNSVFHLLKGAAVFQPPASEVSKSGCNLCRGPVLEAPEPLAIRFLVYVVVPQDSRLDCGVAFCITGVKCCIGLLCSTGKLWGELEGPTRCVDFIRLHHAFEHGEV